MRKRSFKVLIDFRTSRNFLHHYVVNSLRIQTQSQKPFQIVQTDRIHNWQDFICIETEINAIIHGKKWTMIFDILKECKYIMILKLSWLQKANFWIDWTNHKLCFINEAYKIMNQSEICLSKHESWNHEITFLSGKTFT